MRVAVPGVGNRSASIVLVGEQPGINEMRQGKPFVGASGHILNECLQEVGLARGDLYLTNTIKTLEKPLEAFCVKPSKGAPYWTELAAEQHRMLKDEILRIGPNIVVAVGNVAMFALTNRWGIMKWRGSVIESTLLSGLKVMPCIHPAMVIHQHNELLKRQISFDLMRAKKESVTDRFTTIERQLRTAPSFLGTMEFLSECMMDGLSGTVIDIDIEVDMITEEITCIAFANSPIDAMSIPFVDARGDYFTPDQEADIWAAIAQIIEHPKITIRGQNFSFDLHYLMRSIGIKVQGKIHDTMIAQRTILPDFKSGLDYITSTRTDIPYYKDDGKKWISGKGGTWEKFWLYNAMDTIATAAAAPSQMADLVRQDNIAAYERSCNIIPPLLYMQERGIKVDVRGMVYQREETLKRVDKLQAELTELAGFDLNPNSPKQVCDYFYNIRGVSAYVDRKTKKPTANDVAIKRLIRKGFKEAKLIQELRTLTTKTVGTYLNVEKLSNDGRYRSSYAPMGAKTSRLASSENIFGEGGNQQNWPHELMRYLVADDGYMIFSFDLSQAENRIVAYVGMITEMIDAFESGVDIHSLTGALIASKFLERPVAAWEVKAWDDADEKAPIAGGTKTWRYWGKKANHGLNYDQGYSTFSLQNEISETDGKSIVNAYHGVYPGVRSSYHALVRKMLRTNRTVTNLYGRTRLAMGKLDDFTFRDLYAQIPQSSVADKINEDGILYIWDDQETFGPVELLTQIHDSIVFQIPISTGWRHIASILLLIKTSLEKPFSWHGREFIVPADLTIGLNLNKGDSVDIKAAKIPTCPNELAQMLETNYKKLSAEDAERKLVWTN